MGNVYFNGVSSPTGSGFIGNTVSGAIQQDNFWDNDASNQTNAIGATSKTTSQMKSQGTFTNWDFVTPIWSIVQGINDGYPIQQGIISLPVTWQSFTATEQGSGALLQWSTASEQNTKDFVVEYSTNAMSHYLFASVLNKNDFPNRNNTECNYQNNSKKRYSILNFFHDSINLRLKICPGEKVPERP